MSGIQGIIGNLFGAQQVGRSNGPNAGGTASAAPVLGTPTFGGTDSVNFSAANQVGLQGGSRSIYDQLLSGDLNPADQLNGDVLSRLADGSFMNDVIA